MYLAMDDLGADVMEELQRGEAVDKWARIERLALEFKVTGIQFNPVLYRDKLKLSLREIPESIRSRFRCTYHLGGLYCLTSAAEQERLDEALAEAVHIIQECGMEPDLSFHPPFLLEYSEEARRDSVRRLSRTVDRWLVRLDGAGIMLSLETLIRPNYFVFEHLDHYLEFIAGHPGLGMLIDISHNFHDGLALNRLLAGAMAARITGFHLGDARSDGPFETATHLPVGRGEIDFRHWLAPFVSRDRVYAALEIRGSAAEIASSAAWLRDEVLGGKAGIQS